MLNYDSWTTVTEGVFDITTDIVQAVTAKGCLLTQMAVGGPDENAFKIKWQTGISILSLCMYLPVLCIHV